jgi:hypothetical protein
LALAKVRIVCDMVEMGNLDMVGHGAHALYDGVAL